MALIIILVSKSNYSDLASSNHQKATGTANFSGWQQVPIGGGGYVTGIYAHPQAENLVYMQTDNGGAYRWNAEQEKWQNIIDDFPRLRWNYYGVEALALDPHNPDLVYIGLGKYTVNGKGKLWKSSDRGQTWIESDLQVPMGGNEDKRWAGNRLVVSPGDSNLLLFGSRTKGLWRSSNGGLHWSQVNFEVNPRPNIGLIAVAFDPQDPSRVYASAYGDGIYQSNDAGLTWAKMRGSPVQGMRMVIASDRSVYVTSDTSPGVSKYVNHVWQNITPPGYQNQVFNGLSVHQDQANQVLVALGEVSGGGLFYSTDGGNNWSKKSIQPNRTKIIPWWPNSFFNNHTSAVIFDPHHPQRAWLSDWFGVWRTDNLADNRVTWNNYPQGQEQLVTFSLISPPEGTVLLSGVADVEGFYHSSLDQYPQDRFGYGLPKKLRNQYWQDTYSIAYCQEQPLNLVRVGGKRDDSWQAGATSTDGGLTWQLFAEFPQDKIPMRVAVSATNPRQFVIIRSEGQPLQTNDGGNSWQQVSGLPDGIKGPWNWTQPLVADGVNGRNFYYYAESTLYRSDDGGRTFATVNNSFPLVEEPVVKTVPGVRGEVWLSLGQAGLYVSKDGGANFSSVNLVEQSSLVAFGKPKTGDNFPFVYLYGKVRNQGEGIFISRDRGQNWHKLDNVSLFNGDQEKTIRVLEASQQEPGLIFVGTLGRGIYYQYIQDNELNDELKNISFSEKL
jgi:xyloglucan-specific exo-beta-1,4-glucanase